MTRGQAVAALRELGFRVRVRQERSFQPDGVVFAQDPGPNGRLRQGQTVVVTVSFFKARKPPPEPPAPPVSELPRLIGLDYAEAAFRLAEAGVVGNGYPLRSKRPVTIVIAQTPAPGTRIQPGARVRLIVSVGIRRRIKVTVPGTLGLKELAAHARCRDAHLTCRTVLVPTRHPRGPGRVVRQEPEAGITRRELMQMTLYVGR